MAPRRIDFLSLMYKKSSDPGNSPTASRQSARPAPRARGRCLHAGAQARVVPRPVRKRKRQASVAMTNGATAPEPPRRLLVGEAVGQTRRLARSCTKSTTARFWRGSNQSSKAVDCREAALHDLGLETAGARLWLFYKAVPLSDSHEQSGSRRRRRRGYCYGTCDARSHAYE